MPGVEFDFKIFQNQSELEKFICPKCNLLLKDPVQPDCGHWLCQTCAEEILTSTESSSTCRCPRIGCGSDLSSEDGTPGTTEHLREDGFVMKDILSLEVVCQYKDRGCDWDGKFREFEDHKRTCSFASVESNHCHQNDTLDVHSTFSEVEQPMSLASLGYQETDPAFSLRVQTHEDRDEQLLSLTSEVMQPSVSDQKPETEKQELPATTTGDGVKTTDAGYESLPQNTNVDPKLANEMAPHLPMSLEAAQPCPLAPLGCKETGPVSDLKAHMIENRDEHIILLANSVLKMKRIQNMEERSDGGYASLSNELPMEESDPNELMSLVVGRVLQQDTNQELQRLREEVATLRNENADLKEKLHAKSAEGDCI